jgi:hypothetical protein
LPSTPRIERRHAEVATFLRGLVTAGHATIDFTFEGELDEILTIAGRAGIRGRIEIRETGGLDEMGTIEFRGGDVLAAVCGEKSGVEAAKMLIEIDVGHLEVTLSKEKDERPAITSFADLLRGRERD